MFLRSTGDVQIIGMDDLDKLKGKTIIIVEDIIDTGRTMKQLLKTLSKYEPKCKCLYVCQNPEPEVIDIDNCHICY